ncbi:MAG: site-2 protease family protein [Lachnospiraceae bacterium]|nr:site-2 protease family protein [Lachnospiraceae bacterium]
MNVLKNIPYYLISILAIGVIVFVHEMGHFLIAKANGIGVVEFSIGMGPRLLSFEWKGTRYSLKAIPFGGSCQMKGDDFEAVFGPLDDEEEEDLRSVAEKARVVKNVGGSEAEEAASSVTSGESVKAASEAVSTETKAETGKAAVTEAKAESGKIEKAEGFTGVRKGVEDSDKFSSKSVWSRISVIFAGPFFNFLLGVALALVVLGIGGVDLPNLGAVIEGYPAQEAGMAGGDRIVSINGKNCTVYREILLYLTEAKNQPITVTYEHEGARNTVVLTPKLDEETGNYYYGFIMSNRQKVSFPKLLYYSVNEVVYGLKATFLGIKMMFTEKMGINSLAGPVGVTTAISEVAQESSSDGPLYVMLNVFNLMILISVNLGFMNLLPLPALDGGRLSFLFIEALIGKPVPKNKEAIVHLVGIVLLLLLSVVVLFNDIRRLFV